MTEQHPLHSIPELLAPAGEPDSFYGAINAGADAVYLAGEKFGARAYAANFDTNTLVKSIEYAHLFQKKVYLTVNTLFKEDEIEQLYEFIKPFYVAGLDAVIIQDLGVMCFLKTCFPNLELHISTQMTICNEYGARLLKEMGASRIVPARELSLQEIIALKKHSDVEIETFIHGAMCYCYSGQCLFSSMLGGRSGNRGRCAQPCRLPYQVGNKQNTSKEIYPLSLKDMCTIEHLPEFIEAGIDSFKIEGRMKKPEYAAGVTDIYRRAIDTYINLREAYGVQEAQARYSISATDQKSLSSLYIRSEVHDGYYYKHNGKEMITLASPSYSRSDDILLDNIRNNFLKEQKRLPITIHASFMKGESAKVVFQYKEAQVEVIGDVVLAAEKLPLTKENIIKQLSKMGDTCFSIDNIDVAMHDDVFYSLRGLNELRRDATRNLMQTLLSSRASLDLREPCFVTHPHDDKSRKLDESKDSVETGYSILVTNFEQLRTVISFIKDTNCLHIHRLYIEMDCYLQNHRDVLQTVRTLHNYPEIWIALPYVLRKTGIKDMQLLGDIINSDEAITGVLVRTMDELGVLNELPLDRIKKCADAGLYTWNSFAVKQIQNFCEEFTIPYELNAKEQGKLLSRIKQPVFEKVLYGRIPMMITANCVLKTTKACNPKTLEVVSLIDRYDKKFPVLRNCRHCFNIIYNSVPLMLSKSVPNKKGVLRHRIVFTIENKDETIRVLKHYLSDDYDIHKDSPSFEHTTGHEKRGVD